MCLWFICQACLQSDFQRQINCVSRDNDIFCSRSESSPLSAIKFAFHSKLTRPIISMEKSIALNKWFFFTLYKFVETEILESFYYFCHFLLVGGECRYNDGTSSDDFTRSDVKTFSFSYWVHLSVYWSRHWRVFWNTISDRFIGVHCIYK